jgi:hypothetical protein
MLGGLILLNEIQFNDDDNNTNTNNNNNNLAYFLETLINIFYIDERVSDEKYFLYNRNFYLKSVRNCFNYASNYNGRP